ncbi:hypothetical protein POM88_027193 [Heracleum sosnowskyi]|uniref:Protein DETOXIFICATION n=1 Tax=Heracleum sosnowskyi TaxID=360622 RepID=A0AAD8MPW3_9APIA|nr:hypothetical protein POM88_027193 [Heracleum sosnowskyi]
MFKAKNLYKHIPVKDFGLLYVEEVFLTDDVRPDLWVESLLLVMMTAMIVTLYAIPYGLGAGVSTRVSNELGAGNPQGARVAVFVVVIMALSEAIIISGTIFVCRNVSGYTFSNGKEVIFTCVARGCGWQHLGAYVNLVAFYLFGIPIAAALGFWVQLRGKGLWIGIQVGAALQWQYIFWEWNSVCFICWWLSQISLLCSYCIYLHTTRPQTIPQVSSASVNLTTETAVVWPISDAKSVPDWQKTVGTELVKHLTSCGFQSNLRAVENLCAAHSLSRDTSSAQFLEKVHTPISLQLEVTGAFGVFTRSIKFQLPGVSQSHQIDAEDTGSEPSGGVIRNDIVKTDRHDEPVKERPVRRNKKKDKEKIEKASKPSMKSKIEKRLLVLPLETSIIALLLLVLLGAFYVQLNILKNLVGNEVSSPFPSEGYYFDRDDPNMPEMGDRQATSSGDIFKAHGDHVNKIPASLLVNSYFLIPNNYVLFN